MCARSHASGLLQGFGRLHAQIIGWQGGAQVQARDGWSWGGFDVQPVAPIDQHEDRLQGVIAVGQPIHDVQKHIEFGRRRNVVERTHGRVAIFKVTAGWGWTLRAVQAPGVPLRSRVQPATGRSRPDSQSNKAGTGMSVPIAVWVISFRLAKLRVWPFCCHWARPGDQRRTKPTCPSGESKDNSPRMASPSSSNSADTFCTGSWCTVRLMRPCQKPSRGGVGVLAQAYKAVAKQSHAHRTQFKDRLSSAARFRAGCRCQLLFAMLVVYSQAILFWKCC